MDFSNGRKANEQPLESFKVTRYMSRKIYTVFLCLLLFQFYDKFPVNWYNVIIHIKYSCFYRTGVIICLTWSHWCVETYYAMWNGLQATTKHCVLIQIYCKCQYHCCMKWRATINVRYNHYEIKGTRLGQIDCCHNKHLTRRSWDLFVWFYYRITQLHNCDGKLLLSKS